MGHERRVSRKALTLSDLPSWPQWHFEESKHYHKQFVPGEVALSLDGKPLLAQSVRPGLTAVCHLDTPLIPVKSPQSIMPLEEWPSGQGVAVDMAPQVDLHILTERYQQALFASPVAVFVKTALVRARIGAEKSSLIAVLRSMARTASELDDFYHETNEKLPGEFVKRADAWRTEFLPGKPLKEIYEILIRRETQLQVVLFLELFSLDPSVESVLDHHFDRLCIWQAVDETAKGNDITDFCYDLIVPYFKSTAPHKTKDLLKRARGVFYSAQVPRARKRTSATSFSEDKQKKTVKKPAISPYNMILARARAVAHPESEASTADTKKSVQKTALESRKEGSLITAKTTAKAAARPLGELSTASRSSSLNGLSGEQRRNSAVFNRLASNRDTVEVSFRRSASIPAPAVHEESMLQLPAKAPKYSLAGRKVVADRSDTLVQATPSVQRTVMLENERDNPTTLDFDNDDAIDSTDSD